MNEPVWVDDKEAEAINMMVIAQFGGYVDGVRDENLFKAAMARPLNKWYYNEPKPDLFSLAAAYCYGICSRHVFHDGNKRTAYVVPLPFSPLMALNVCPTRLILPRPFFPLPLVAFLKKNCQNGSGKMQIDNW